jgi:hypothetical protein
VDGKKESRSFEDFTYSSELIGTKIDDYHQKVSITRRTLVLVISRKFHVVYYTRKRQDG